MITLFVTRPSCKDTLISRVPSSKVLPVTDTPLEPVNSTLLALRTCSV